MNRIKAQLVRYEGLRLKPYRYTAGKLTICIGRNLDDWGISQTEAMCSWRMISRTARSSCWMRFRRFIIHWIKSAGAAVKHAFQPHIGGLLSFNNTLAFIAAGDWERAATELLTRGEITVTYPHHPGIIPVSYYVMTGDDTGMMPLRYSPD